MKSDERIKILDLLKKGKTPMQIISAGANKNTVYNIHARYQFIARTSVIFAMIEDAVMRMSVREFAEFREYWEPKCK